MTTEVMFEVGDEVRFDDSPNTEIIVNINEEGEINGKYHTGIVSGSYVDPKDYTLVKKAKGVIKTKFKKGDEVRCIDSSVKISSDSYGGSGWKRGLVFKIKTISCQDDEYPIYWEGKNYDGVYEPFLELANKEVVKTDFKVGDEVLLKSYEGHSDY